MKISEVIEKLIEAKNMYGDIDVMTDSCGNDWGDYNIDELNIVEFDDVKYVKFVWNYFYIRKV